MGKVTVVPLDVGVGALSKTLLIEDGLRSTWLNHRMQLTNKDLRSLGTGRTVSCDELAGSKDG